MDFSTYDDYVQTEIEYMEKNRFTKPEEIITRANAFMNYAQEQNDMDLIGYADFYLGDAYFTLGNTEQCFIYINRAIQEFTLSENWYKVGGCYNLLGILFSNQGDMSNALNNYFEAISLAERHNDNFVASLAYENYAEVCEICHSNELALQNALKSKELLLQCKDNPRFLSIYTIVLASILKNYLKLDKIEEATETFNELVKVYNDNEMESGIDFVIEKVFYASKTGKLDENLCVTEAVATFHNCEFKTDYFIYIQDFMYYLIKTNRYDLLKGLIAEMESTLTESNYPAYQQCIMDIKIDYLIHEHKKDELMEALLNYRKYYKLQLHQNTMTLNLLTNLKDSLDLSKQNNLILQEKMSMDELTGISNRRKFTKISKQFMDRARQYQTTIGVEMLDIDKFKEINDSYGHRVGDLCLNAVGTVLNSIQNDSIFCSRYGGDEFCIIFYNYSEHQIHEICDDISEKIKDVFIIKRLPITTISQGIYNQVPSMSDTITNYLTMADKALYKCKRSGGNIINITQQ